MKLFLTLYLGLEEFGWCESESQRDDSFQSESVCGSVLIVLLNCVLQALIEGRSFPRIFKG